MTAKCQCGVLRYGANGQCNGFRAKGCGFNPLTFHTVDPQDSTDTFVVFATKSFMAEADLQAKYTADPCKKLVFAFLITDVKHETLTFTMPMLTGKIHRSLGSMMSGGYDLAFVLANVLTAIPSTQHQWFVRRNDVMWSVSRCPDRPFIVPPRDRWWKSRMRTLKVNAALVGYRRRSHALWTAIDLFSRSEKNILRLNELFSFEPALVLAVNDHLIW